MNNKTITTAVIALIVGAGIGYMAHTPKIPAGAQRTSFTGGNAAFGGARGMGNFLTGTIAAKDASSITLNTRDGSSHVVLLSPSTSVSRTIPGSLADVLVGTSVMVTGTTNSGGSVSASNIQLRPATSTTPRAQ